MIRILILLGLMTSSAAAGTYIVDATDPAAHFQDLQLALDSVPSSSTLMLRSNFTGNFIIQDSVALIGDGPASGRVTLFGSLGVTGYYFDILLQKVNVDARGSGSSFGVDTSKACNWHLDQLEVWSDMTESYGVVVWDDTVATFTDCVLWGPDYQSSQFNENALASWVPDDGAVFLKDCALRTLTGKPGEVLSGSDIYIANTLIEGDVFRIDEVIELPDTLSLREWSFRIGSRARIQATGTPLGVSVLYFSFEPPQAPVKTSAGFWQLGTPVWRMLNVYDAMGQWTVEADLPLDPDLIGLQMSFQAFDVSKAELSSMEAGIIGS